MNNEFNLIDEKWIPVLTCTGEVPRVGIKDALLKAHDIRDIAASNPMDRIAVLRFLLAVLYWCKGNPSEKDKQVAAFPVDWFAKLEEHRECFNLLGEGRRFYQ
ncbi:type I-E CRISPR-associated protein Cse1/CasA, partial [bacterium]|nr:type I-E CRISPR-associated protein Cse1/CasA [bacterium]